MYRSDMSTAMRTTSDIKNELVLCTCRTWRTGLTNEFDYFFASGSLHSKMLPEMPKYPQIPGSHAQLDQSPQPAWLYHLDTRYCFLSCNSADRHVGSTHSLFHVLRSYQVLALAWTQWFGGFEEFSSKISTFRDCPPTTGALRQN